MRSRSCWAVFLAIGLGVVAFACQPAAPARGVEASCADACGSHAPGCGEVACARGCNLVIDRLVEHEGDAVVECVAKAGGSCDDRTWARCAARVGPHVDGGPPPPPAASDDDQN
jgi:hypothetical protein